MLKRVQHDGAPRTTGYFDPDSVHQPKTPATLFYTNRYGYMPLLQHRSAAIKPSKHLNEPTGRMVNNHGHWEFQYDPPVTRKSDAPGYNLESYQTVELRRRKDGWTAERQRQFLNTLANTGSVAHAAEAADITPRSAYRLRNHPQGAAFARAMDTAS